MLNIYIMYVKYLNKNSMILTYKTYFMLMIYIYNDNNIFIYVKYLHLFCQNKSK